jgi:prepilin signal peptidase PulO-like enzyme (type II secretory pathway)
MQALLRRIQWVISIIAAVSFIAGYIIAIVAGIWWPNSGPLILTLVILGLIVGILNITGPEIIPYLIAAIALVIVGNFEAFTPLNDVKRGLGDNVNQIVRLMAVFTAPAAVVQAIRAGIVLARPNRE